MAESENSAGGNLWVDGNDPAAIEGVYAAEWKEIDQRRTSLMRQPGSLRAALTAKRISHGSDRAEKKISWLEAASEAAGTGGQWARDVADDVREIVTQPTTADPPTKLTDLELTGLAFSGGGIRSATFNLGVLQALDHHGMLCHIDYLSTVSGGGYIGSSYSTWLSDPPPATTPSEPPFPFEHTPAQQEGVEMRHLRDFADYLAPQGLRDQLKFPWLLVRGIVVNFLLVLPWVIGAVLITVMYWGPKNT